jgi:hypothetical protein
MHQLVITYMGKGTDDHPRLGANSFDHMVFSDRARMNWLPVPVRWIAEYPTEKFGDVD